MNKKIKTIGIISMFLLVGIVSASASNNIESLITPTEKLENGDPESLAPSPFPKHIKGSGTGIAFKIGRILFTIAWLPRTTIAFEMYYYSNPDYILEASASRILLFRFKGDLVKQGDYFEFEGDAGLMLWDYYIPPEK